MKPIKKSTKKYELCVTQGKLGKGIVCLMAIIFGFSSFSSAETVVKATRTISPPIIDGRLMEASWQGAIPTTGFRIMNTGKFTPYRTAAYILFDDDYIYLGVRAYEPEIDNIRTVPREHDEGVFRDDSIELMLDTTLEETDYFHFVVNASGSTFDRSVTQGGHVGNVDWDGTWKVRSFIGEDYWSTEMAIPFHALGITPEVNSTWGINICRNRWGLCPETRSPFYQNSSIAEDGTFNIAGKFAHLEGLEVNFKELSYSVGVISISTEIKDEKLHATVKVPVENLTGERREIKVESWLIDSHQKPHIASDILELKPGEKKELKIGPFVLEVQGEHEGHLMILEPRTQRVLHLARTKLEVAFIPIAVDLIEPFYRDAIFATQNLEKVILNVRIALPEEELSDKTLVIGIKEEDKPELIVEKTVKSPDRISKAEFLNHKLPYGNLLIVASLKDERGEIVATTEHPLQKLPHKKGEVWLGSDLNWYVDGQPFFFLGTWGVRRANPREYDYLTVLFGQEPRRPGQMRVLSAPELFPTALREKPLEAQKEHIRKTVRRFRDRTDIFGYQLIDEPSQPRGASVETIEALYGVIKEEDPYRPVIITFNCFSDARHYAHGVDLISFHRYPRFQQAERVNDMSSVMAFADKCQEVGEEYDKFIGFLVQGFNYGDHGHVNERMRTYHEARATIFMAMIGGGRGFIQYDRTTHHYYELTIGSLYHLQELVYLSRAIMAADSKLPVKVSSEDIRARLKDVEGELYLFTVNVSLEPKEVKITIPGLSKQGEYLYVISGDRKVRVEGDSFTDTFEAFEVHIYTTSQEETGLTPVKEIIRKIDKANQARRKPGNLVFQMYEGTPPGIQVRASSNRHTATRRIGSGLWHLMDGIISELDDPERYRGDHYWATIWSDNTPGESPDWVEVKLPDKHSIGRVVVYNLVNSLRDYEIQAYVAGSWVTVDSISGNKEGRISHTFTPVSTDRIRVWITRTTGPHAIISEIEIYER